MTATVERMLRAHTKIKAARSALSREFKEADKALKEKLATVENGILKVMNDTGVDQLKVKGIALAYRNDKMMASCKDWNGLWTHITDTGNFDLVQRRLSSTAVKEYIEAHEGAAPPGVHTHVERGVTVRRES